MGILDNIRVLVVDDETDLRDILQEEFEALGAKVVTANNGKEAFELVKKNELDFVVTDVRMPVGDGVELLDNIRAHNRTIPVVIFLTGFSDLTNDIAFHKGAAAIFSKPFDIEAVAETISKFMKKPEERWQRIHERVECDLEINLQLPNLEHAIKGRILNIGQGGLFIALDSYPPEIGSLIMTNISFESGEPKHFTTKGIVRWRREKKVNDLPMGIGIEFYNLKKEEIDVIIKMISELKPSSFIPKA